MQVCNKCGFSGIQVKGWIHMNSEEVETYSGSSTESKDFWCPKCEEHHLPIDKQEFRKIPNGQES